MSSRPSKFSSARDTAGVLLLLAGVGLLVAVCGGPAIFGQALDRARNRRRYGLTWAEALWP